MIGWEREVREGPPYSQHVYISKSICSKRAVATGVGMPQLYLRCLCHLPLFVRTFKTLSNSLWSCKYILRYCRNNFCERRDYRCHTDKCMDVSAWCFQCNDIQLDLFSHRAQILRGQCSFVGDSGHHMCLYLCTAVFGDGTYDEEVFSWSDTDLSDQQPKRTKPFLLHMGHVPGISDRLWLCFRWLYPTISYTVGEHRAKRAH